MTPAMDVSVVLATYNRAALLPQALAALAAQQVPAGVTWEVVVVDNNSRDATRAVVEAASSRSPAPVRYVFEPRQGLSHARNTGVAAARGAIVAFTDDDVTPAPDWVAKIPAAVRQHAADAVGGRILPKWSSPPPAWLGASPALLHRLAMLDTPAPGRVSPAGGAIFGANMAFRRSLFDAIGLFDVRLGPNGGKFARHEESDLLRRAHDAGKTIVYDPALVVWHHVGPERMRKAYFRKLSFDTGEGEARGGARSTGHGARAVYWDVAAWVSALRRHDLRAFQRETELWGHAGYLWGRLRSARG